MSRLIMKTRHSKYSVALSIHTDVRTKSQRLRRIPTSLHRCILKNHVILYCMKRSLHKWSLTLRHIGHTRINYGFFKFMEALLQIHSCFFSQSTNVRGLPLSACHCLAALPAKTSAFKSLMQQNACHRNIK